MISRDIRIVLFLFALVALWRPAAFAHEGHQHHIMGTVASVDEHKIEVETTEGKTVAVALTKTTRILRGKEPASATDIKRGARVVIEAKGAPDKLTATVVHLAARSK